MANRQASVGFILFTVFLDVLGIGLMIPVLPLLIGELTHNAEAQVHWYGLLAATYGVLQFCCAPLLGALSDRYGRRPVLLLSIFGLGFSHLVTALTHALPLLLLTRIVSGATGASMSVANAYIADITPAEQRGKAFGLVGAAFGLGFIFGPVLGGLLGAHDIRLPFLVAAGLAFINGLYGVLVLPESLPAERRSAVQWRKANPFGALAYLGQLRGIGGLVAVFALNSLAQFTLQNTWVLYTHLRFGWGPQENGMALFVVGLNSALVQGLLLGKLLQRFGEARLAVTGLLSSMLAYIAYGLTTQGWVLYVFILANFLSFAVAPALQSLISRAASANEQGLAQGALNGIASIMIIVAPLAGTSLLAGVSHLPAGDWRLGSTFFVCAGVQLLAALVAAAHFRRQQYAH